MGSFPILDVLASLPLCIHQHPLLPHLHHLLLSLFSLPLELRRRSSKVEVSWILITLGKNLGNCSVCTSSKGLPCQLPFLFDGQEFHSCTNHSDSRLWCATRLNHILPTLCFILGINRVDSEGRLLRGVEAWDYCPSPCPAAGKLQAQRC